MSEAELLDDLEEFLDGDWKKIYEENKAEEYRQEISEPVIPDFPKYEEFYKLLVHVMGREDLPPELDYLIHKVIRNQNRKATEEFDKIWEFFCNPYVYKIDKVQCLHCNKKHTVITKIPDRIDTRIWQEAALQEITIEREDIYCPACGCRFLVVAHGEGVEAIF